MMGYASLKDVVFFVSGLSASVSSVVAAISGALAALVLTIRCHLMVQGLE